MDKLSNPWVFAAAGSGLVGIATYVWAQLTDRRDACQAASGALVITLLSLLLLTWLAQGSTSAVLVEPFPGS